MHGAEHVAVPGGCGGNICIDVIEKIDCVWPGCRIKPERGARDDHAPRNKPHARFQRVTGSPLTQRAFQCCSFCVGCFRRCVFKHGVDHVCKPDAVFDHVHQEITDWVHSFTKKMRTNPFVVFTGTWQRIAFCRESIRGCNGGVGDCTVFVAAVE